MCACHVALCRFLAVYSRLTDSQCCVCFGCLTATEVRPLARVLSTPCVSQNPVSPINTNQHIKGEEKSTKQTLASTTVVSLRRFVQGVNETHSCERYPPTPRVRCCLSIPLPSLSLPLPCLMCLMHRSKLCQPAAVYSPPLTHAQELSSFFFLSSLAACWCYVCERLHPSLGVLLPPPSSPPDKLMQPRRYSRGGGPPYGGGFSSGFGSSFPRRSQNVNVFFTGVPLNVDKGKVRQHFESIGHVMDFKIFDPKPGIDYRHGLVEYMDERTAADAISRLNGTTFGDRAMRVAEAKQRGKDFKFAKRGREPGGSVGFGGDGPRRREGMTFPRGFQDPVLGRGEGIVFDVLKSMTTEDAYEAVEQLRVLALERRRDARALLLDNPALRSAVVMILQHAGRLPLAGGSGGGSSLPPEAFQGSSATAYDGAANDDEADDADGSGNANTEGAPSAKRQATEAEKEATKGEAAAKQQQDEVLEIISAMSEEDVDRILTMTSQDLAQVADPAQRRQLEVLRDRLIEMSSEL